MLARDHTGFRYISGTGTTNIVAPDEFSSAALQNGDIARTGYILLEKRPAANNTRSGNSLGSLFNGVKSLGSIVGIGKKEDYALFHIETGRIVPVNSSLNEEHVQVLSERKRQNAIYSRWAKMESFNSRF